MTSRQKLAEDRALRDAARRNLDEDLAYLREDVGERGISRRLFDTTLGATRKAGDAMQVYTRRHPFRIASSVVVLAAGATAFFRRAAILGALHKKRDAPAPERTERLSGRIRSQITKIVRPGETE